MFMIFSHLYCFFFFLFSFIACSADLETEEKIDLLVEDLRLMAHTCKEGGLCLRKYGTQIRESAKSWNENAKLNLDQSLNQYREEITPHITQMKNLKNQALKDRTEGLNDLKIRDYSNEKIEIWNKFIESSETIIKKIHGNKKIYKYVKEESWNLLEYGASMMNGGMHIFFKGCDFDIEASIFDEYGFDLTKYEFETIFNKLKIEERGQ